MANDPLRAYFDAQKPSEAALERLSALQPPPKRKRRLILPLAAALLLLALAIGVRVGSGTVLSPVRDDFGLTEGGKIRNIMQGQGSDAPAAGDPAPPEEDAPEIRAEYRLENGRHLIALQNAAGAATTNDVTDEIVDGHYAADILVGKEYVHVDLTIRDDGTADLIVGTQDEKEDPQ